jgi:hypothetical protein
MTKRPVHRQNVCTVLEYFVERKRGGIKETKKKKKKKS